MYMKADTNSEPVATDTDLMTTFRSAITNCRLTHVDSTCNISAMVETVLLRGLIRREVLHEQQINPLIQTSMRHIDWLAQTRDSDVSSEDFRAYYAVDNKDLFSRIVTAETLEELELDRMESAGEVWRCLGAGIFCLRAAMTRLEASSSQQRELLRKSLFEQLITDLIMQGGAAQANAVVAGALLGAYLGYDAVPERWRKGLSHRDFLMRKCKLLCLRLNVIDGFIVAEDDSGLIGRLLRDGLEERERARAAQIAARLAVLQRRRAAVSANV